MSPCVVIVVLHLISCHHVHCICICVHLMHSSIFPVVRFAFRRSYVLWCPFLPLFMCGCLNVFRLDRDFPCSLGLLLVDRLSSFVSFGLRLILQRLTEGPKRPRDRCKGVPSFDEMVDFALVEVDFDDPTTNVRGRRDLAIANPIF